MSTTNPLQLRCKAKSKTSGTQCKRTAIHGGTVCRYHGGAAPQVMAKARERLAAMLPTACDQMEKLMHAESEQVQLGAVKDVFDRNGIKPNGDVSVDGDLTFTLHFDRRPSETPDAA